MHSKLTRGVRPRSLSGSSVLGILLARILVWAVIPFSTLTPYTKITSLENYSCKSRRNLGDQFQSFHFLEKSGTQRWEVIDPKAAGDLAAEPDLLLRFPDF